MTSKRLHFRCINSDVGKDRNAYNITEGTLAMELKALGHISAPLLTSCMICAHHSPSLVPPHQRERKLFMTTKLNSDMKALLLLKLE